MTMDWKGIQGKYFQTAEHTNDYFLTAICFVGAVFASSLFDFRKNQTIMNTVTIGDTNDGMCAPNASSSIIMPRNATEYIAPFFRYLYFFTFSMLLTVI